MKASDKAEAKKILHETKVNNMSCIDQGNNVQIIVISSEAETMKYRFKVKGFNTDREEILEFEKSERLDKHPDDGHPI